MKHIKTLKNFTLNIYRITRKKGKTDEKKALIIISIIVVAFIIILLPKNNSNIEKTTAETNLTKPTPEATPSPTSIPDLTPTPKTETGVTEFNAKQGIIEGYEVTIDTTETTTTEEEANLAEEVVVEAETQDEIEYDNYLQEAENEHKKDTSDIVESDIETLDKTMYAQGNVNTRSGPSQDFEKIGGLAVNQEVKVTGQSKETGWYEIEVNGSKQYVSNKFLADSKITVTTNTDNTTNTGNVDSNTGSNDILPGGNDNWSGSDGDAASFFNSLPSVGSAPSGHAVEGEGIHAE